MAYMMRCFLAATLLLSAAWIWAAPSEAMAQELPVVDAPRTGFVQPLENGRIDWNTWQVEAQGVAGEEVAMPGSVQTGEAANATREPRAAASRVSQAMLLREATVKARRNLVKMVYSIAVDSRTTIGRAVAKNENISSALTGYVQNSAIGGVAWLSDGSVRVDVNMDLRGDLARLVVPATIQFGSRVSAEAPSGAAPGASSEPVPAAQAFPGPDQEPPAFYDNPLAPLMDHSKTTGLVVDARGLDLEPALLPRIVDEDGRELYGPVFVNKNQALSSGLVAYVAGEDNTEIPRRAGDAPLVIKATEKAGALGTDLRVSRGDSLILMRLAGLSDVLRRGRVVVIIE